VEECAAVDWDAVTASVLNDRGDVMDAIADSSIGVGVPYVEDDAIEAFVPSSPDIHQWIDACWIGCLL